MENIRVCTEPKEISIPFDEYKRLLELSLRVEIMKDFVKVKDRDYLNSYDLKWMFGFVDEETENEDV